MPLGQCPMQQPRQCCGWVSLAPGLVKKVSPSGCEEAHLLGPKKRDDSWEGLICSDVLHCFLHFLFLPSLGFIFLFLSFTSDFYFSNSWVTLATPTIWNSSSIPNLSVLCMSLFQDPCSQRGCSDSLLPVRGPPPAWLCVLWPRNRHLFLNCHLWTKSINLTCSWGFQKKELKEELNFRCMFLCHMPLLLFRRPFQS